MTTKRSYDKQELALQIAKTFMREWRTEEARAHDGVTTAKISAVGAIRSAVAEGVSQAAIAEAVGLSRQRIHQLLG